jgi:hypothetical protein
MMSTAIKALQDSNQAIEAIRTSEAVTVYNTLFRRIMAADMAASSALQGSIQQEAWTDHVINLYAEIKEACPVLLAALIAEGHPVEQIAGGGEFAIYYRGEGFAASLAGQCLPSWIKEVAA